MNDNHFSFFKPIIEPEGHVQELLKKYSETWEKRSMVKRQDFDDIVPVFSKKHDDFLEELLPFSDHPAYINETDKFKKTIMTCGWLIYNQKTVAIENKIVNPVCSSIICREVPELNDPYSILVANETLVDESYHSLLAVKTSFLTSKMRGIYINIPEFNLIKKMEDFKSTFNTGWQKNMVQISTAIVSEVFISNYLGLLSGSSTVQPINRISVETHLKDELMHGHAFKLLAKQFFKNLDDDKKIFFSQILPKPAIWFSDLELDIWESVLKQIGFRDTEKMIFDCKEKNKSCIKKMDFSKLFSLADEIGVIGLKNGINSFEEEGLTQNSPESYSYFKKSKL